MKAIRTVKKSDAKDLLEIYTPYVTDSPISFEIEPPSAEEFQQRISTTLEVFPWLVYEVENQVVGYAYAAPFKNRPAYNWSVESTVYIHKNFHRKGIGKELYQELFRSLREQGVVNVIAGITIPNETSIKMHEHLGFVNAARFKDAGFKLGRWWDVGYWQLQLQKPQTPMNLLKTKVF